MGSVLERFLTYWAIQEAIYLLCVQDPSQCPIDTQIRNISSRWDPCQSFYSYFAEAYLYQRSEIFFYLRPPKINNYITKGSGNFSFYINMFVDTNMLNPFKKQCHHLISLWNLWKARREWEVYVRSVRKLQPLPTHKPRVLTHLSDPS